MRFLTFCLLVTLVACSSTAPKHDCGGHLRPINKPAAVVPAPPAEAAAPSSPGSHP